MNGPVCSVMMCGWAPEKIQGFEKLAVRATNGDPAAKKERSLKVIKWDSCSHTLSVFCIISFFFPLLHTYLVLYIHSPNKHCLLIWYGVQVFIYMLTAPYYCLFLVYIWHCKESRNVPLGDELAPCQYMSKLDINLLCTLHKIDARWTFEKE